MDKINPIATYLEEAEELLAETEQCALGLRSGEAAPETIHQIFRAFHTIKGSGAMCGFDRVAAFTHHVETALDKARGGAVPVTPALGSLILSAGDHIRSLLAAESGGPAVSCELSERLISAFRSLEAAPADDEVRNWRIEFHPDPSLLACGGNPILLLRDLRRLGPCEIVAHTDQMPTLDTFRPDVCYLWWTITLRTAASRDAIRDVFLFVEDGSRLEIEPAAPKPVSAVPGSLAGATPAPKSSAPKRESTVRVPASRLDRLVNLVGELVMTQSRLSQVADSNAAPELANPVQELERLVAELRDDVLGIRMLPIGTIFGRFRRVVHDLSAELGKEAELVATGDETELDKSVLDLIAEPLAHLLRNAIDHGIEPPDERARDGKPRRGTIRLAAEHTGASVVVSIEDDGRGINRAAVRARAVEKQLIASDAPLTDKEIVNLILLPGFSTAREVTSVSGRGVGMDVVKRQVEALRGAVAISSEEGKGSRISLTLPLTLAIIEGLLVELGSDRVIIPMAEVLENVELHRFQRERRNGRNVVAVRGELIPYIDLRGVFQIEGEPPQIERIVILRHEEQRVGLVVDRVVGTHQTVIQSLGRFFRSAAVVSGATIMGDGRVALILNVFAVVRHAQRQSGIANV